MPWETSAVTDQLRGVVWGHDNQRIRAIYRILFPMLLLTMGLSPLSVTLAEIVVPSGSSGVMSMLATGLLQAALVAGLLVVWARYLDRRPVGGYGLSASPRWVLDVAVAFGAVLAGHAVWYAVGSAFGWTDVTLVLSSGDVSIIVGLVAMFVAVGVNALVQESVMVAIPLRNAAEGLAAWGVTPRRAVLAGWALATLLFAFAHGRSGLLAWVNLLVALGVFALLYAHTGELALPVGVHFAVNFSGNALFVPASRNGGLAVFRVAESLGGLAGSLSGGRLPQILVAYLLLLGWLRWRYNTVSIRANIAVWAPRQQGVPTDDHTSPAD